MATSDIVTIEFEKGYNEQLYPYYHVPNQFLNQQAQIKEEKWYQYVWWFLNRRIGFLD